MFTGIIESVGEVVSISEEGSNRTFTISASFPETIKVDQSIAHSGVCLTVTEIFENDPKGPKNYTVTAIRETLDKTDLGSWKTGSKVNIERCMRPGDRLDGHFVQGHVDTRGTVKWIREEGGSWSIGIGYPPEYDSLIVNKGSITLNGISLTVVEAREGVFSVAIIPFTWEHTNLHSLREGDPVNLEFDILGKYIQKMVSRQQN